MNPVGQRHPGSPAAHKYAGTAKSHHRMILYPFQREAKDAVLRHWEKGNRAALISLPTGSGKTIVFSDILQSSLSGTRDKGLVLVHRDELAAAGDRKAQLRVAGSKTFHRRCGFQQLRRTDHDRKCHVDRETPG